MPIKSIEVPVELFERLFESVFFEKDWYAQIMCARGRIGIGINAQERDTQLSEIWHKAQKLLEEHKANQFHQAGEMIMKNGSSIQWATRDDDKFIGSKTD